MTLASIVVLDGFLTKLTVDGETFGGKLVVIQANQDEADESLLDSNKGSDEVIFNSDPRHTC